MKLRTLFAVAVLVALAATDAQAARLLLTEESTLDVADIAARPVVNAMNGSEYDFHVWLVPDPDQNYIGVAYNIATDNPAAVTIVESVFDNPQNGGLTRWGSVNNGTPGGTLDPDGAAQPLPPENMIVQNSRGAVIVIGTNPGIGSLPQHATDPGFDADTGAFHIGRVRVRGTATTGSAGLFLRQGTALMNIRNGAGTTITNSVPLFFGDNATSPVNAGSAGRNRGDDMTAVNADAMLVFGGPPARTEIIQFTEDPNNMGQQFLAPAPANVQPRNFELTPPSNMVQLDARGVQHSFFDVFFDINVNDDATLTTLAAGLFAQEGPDGANFVRVVPEGSNPLGNGIDYDLHIQYTNTPGADRFLDIDASSVPGLLINNIAIPEPSTWALAACALIGLGLARRRRGQHRRTA